MSFYIIKIFISAFIILIVSEISKTNTFFGSLLASIPTVSILAIIWLFYETGDLIKIRELSSGIFFLTIPSLVFFISFPFLLKYDFNFIFSIIISILITIFTYKLYLTILQKFGIKF